MATLECAKDDGHLFIRVSPSEGTKQIHEEGMKWLKEQNHQIPKLGEGVSLKKEFYRYLLNKGYLYIKGDLYDKREVSTLSCSSIEKESNGPALLLQLGEGRGSSKVTANSWSLIIKLDELEESMRNILPQHRAIAVTLECLLSSKPMISWQYLQNPRYWPKVPPQAKPYNIYWQDSQKHSLNECIPTPGLQEGWQGNIFIQFESSQLMGTWRRCRPNEKISADDCKELYWLAQINYDPAEWPGQTQPIGSNQQGWQLWQLQIKADDTPWEAVEQWLSYRMVKLTYPSWRLRIINPLSVVTDRQHIRVQSQHLLLQCDPPNQQSENMCAHASLSIIPIHRTVVRKQTQALAQPKTLQPNQTNYFHYLALHPDLECRVRLRGQTSGQPLSVCVVPLPKTQPTWLRGLSCILTTARTRRTLHAFNHELEIDQSFNFCVPNDFSLEELPHLAWSLEPAGIPFSCTYEYLSPQGKRQDNISLSTDSNFNAYWQMHIWPTLAPSPWTRITIDAASFGRISLVFLLKPERSVNQHWWMDEQLSASFLWLSRVGLQEPGRISHPVSHLLQERLRQLYQSAGMPPALNAALARLTTLKSMPLWIQVRLKVLLTEITQRSGS